MSVITRKQLLEAGVHFGHHTRRWNPKMKEYIFGERNGVYIIDLEKTVNCLEDAYAKMRQVVQDSSCKVLFVGTRKQISDIIREEAVRAGQYYVDKRWLGGTMTNFKTIRKSIAKMFKYEEMEKDGTFDLLPKKEVIEIKKELAKLQSFFSGIREMTTLPGALFVVDPKTEHNAVMEARKLNIPVFGLVDTNCDPDDVDYVIPANDDGVRAVRLVVGVMANAVMEGNGIAVEPYVLPEEEKTEEEPANPKFNRNPRFENKKFVKAEEAAPAEVKEEVVEAAPVEEAPKAKKATKKEEVAPVEEAPKAKKATKKEEVAPAEEAPKAKKATKKEEVAAVEEAPKAKKATKKAEDAPAEEAPKAKKATKKAEEAPVEEAPKAKKATKKAEEAPAEEAPKAKKTTKKAAAKAE